MSKPQIKLPKISTQSQVPHTPEPSPDNEVRMPIGQVVSVAGSQVLIMVDLRRDASREHMPRVGRMICIETGASDIVAGVSGLSSPTPGIDSEEGQVLLAELELIGEFQKSDSGIRNFNRGISTFPALGDTAAGMTEADLALVYGMQGVNSMRVGRVSDASGIAARIDPTALMQGNFALFGANGTGKSCAAAVLVRALVKNRYPGRIILVDPHHEYTRSFGRAANVIKVANGLVAHWMLSIRELVYLFEKLGGSLSKPEIDLLGQAICAAKKRFAQADPTSKSIRAAGEGLRISVDTPIPYRLTDVTAFLDRGLQAEGEQDPEVSKQLRGRIEAASKDHQYKVLFGGIAMRDSLAGFLGDIFRIPTAGKPITVLQFGDLEQQICEVIVSVIARYAQLIASAQNGSTPFLLLLEEAHRFLPENSKLAPVSSRTLHNLMEKSSKLNVSLGLISSRIRSLSPASLERCGTMLALRLPSRADQDYLFQITPETASGLLANVGVIDAAECVAVGAGVTVPMRFGFARLPAEAIPADKNGRAEAEGELPPPVTELGQPFLESLIDRWRYH